MKKNKCTHKYKVVIRGGARYKCKKCGKSKLYGYINIKT